MIGSKSTSGMLTRGVTFLLLACAVISCASSSGSGRLNEGSTSACLANEKEGFDATNRYCEIIACVGEIKDACEMRIGIMKNYDAPVQKKHDDSYMLKVDKAISIEYLQDWMLKDSLSLGRFGRGDKLLYRTYAGVTTEYYARHHNSLLQVTRKIRLDDDAPGYAFTFRQMLKAAETLLYQDRIMIGKETLYVKRRELINVPADSFFMAPIKHADLY